MMECVGISCFDGEQEEELVAAAPEEVLLLGTCEKNWRTEGREGRRGAVDGKSPQFRRRRRSVGGEAYEG